MHEIYELKEMLMKELEEYGKKGEMSSGSLEVVDKLSHTIKNLCKIIEDMEESEGGSSYYGGGSSRRGGSSYEGRESGQSRRGGSSYENRGGGSSYARGRGRNARRDSMGRYSSEGGYSMAAEDMVMELRELMEDAPDDRTRQEFQRFIQKIEQM